jgi:hypothetical protein
MSRIFGSRRRQVLFATVWLTALAMVATGGVGAVAASSTSELDLAPDGQQANGLPSAVAVAADGRYVAFASTATNLVPGDTNHASDVFVRDVQTGKTERVSVTSAGGQADGQSYGPLAISADGRYIAFQSEAPNLLNNPPDEVDTMLVIRDTVAGTTSTAPHEQFPLPMAISADGRYLAYDQWDDSVVRRDLTTGSTLEVGYGNTAWAEGISDDGAKVLWSSQDDLNLHLWNAATHTNQIVNRSRDGRIMWGASSGFLSGDGRYVLFSHGGKTVHGRVQGSAYVRDLALASTNRIDISTAGVPMNGFALGLSNHGRYRFFCAPSQIRREFGMFDAFVRDSHTRTTRRVAPFGGFTCDGAITANARYLAWISAANWLVPYDQNGLPGVFWRGPLY